MKLIFAVLDVSLTMGLTRCNKTEGFFTLIWATIYYRLADELCRSAAYFRFVSAFCFTCTRRWLGNLVKQPKSLITK